MVEIGVGKENLIVTLQVLIVFVGYDYCQKDQYPIEKTLEICRKNWNRGLNPVIIS
jgi:hypothetical protein